MKKAIVIIVLLIPFVLVGIILIPKGIEINKQLNSSIIDKGYCYIEKNDTITEAFYVFSKSEIDKLSKYYDSKVLKKYEYDFEGYSFLKKIPLDKEINVKSYLKDSTIISFEFGFSGDSLNAIRGIGYVPAFTFHSNEKKNK